MDDGEARCRCVHKASTAEDKVGEGALLLAVARGQPALLDEVVSRAADRRGRSDFRRARNGKTSAAQAHLYLPPAGAADAAAERQRDAAETAVSGGGGARHFAPRETAALPRRTRARPGRSHCEPRCGAEAPCEHPVVFPAREKPCENRTRLLRDGCTAVKVSSTRSRSRTAGHLRPRPGLSLRRPPPPRYPAEEP